MSKQIQTPFGRIYPVELLLIVIVAAIIIAMLIFAATVTQYVAAIIAVLAGIHNLYTLMQPSRGDYDFGSGIVWMISAVIVVLMIIIYVTTLF